MVKRLISNPWVWVLSLPPILFIILMAVHVSSDAVSLVFGFLLFLIISVAASKYALRAPVLIWQGTTSNEAVNIAGWAFVMLALEATQTYRWIFISLGRPEWLIGQYWNAAIIYTMFCGFCMVAWSTRRTLPRPPNGRVSLGGFVVGFATALGLMLSGILPALVKMLLATVQGLAHAV